MRRRGRRGLHRQQQPRDRRELLGRAQPPTPSSAPSPTTAARPTRTRSPPQPRHRRRSPAANRCTGTDQRGIPRPQGGTCDIGAFEYVAPRLTVTTTVINNDGGEDQPADFSVRVTAAGADVAGSPQPGSATGTTYTLVPGGFRVSADGPNLYALTIGGACTAAGDVSLSENQAVTCTVTANDRQPRAGREVGSDPGARDGPHQEARRPLPRHAGGRHAAQRHHRRHAEGPDHADRRRANRSGKRRRPTSTTASSRSASRRAAGRPRRSR